MISVMIVKYFLSFRTPLTGFITPANNYINPVIPEKSGIQLTYWMPDQVRHDNRRV
jgi:hypothetical protein